MPLPTDSKERARPPALVRVFRNLSVGCFGIFVTIWVVDNAGPRAEVAVHVMERDVDLVVAGYYRRVDGLVTDPFMFSLPRGTHELVMTRNGVILHQESFEVSPGRSFVITAWNSLAQAAPSVTIEPPLGGEEPPRAAME